MIFQDKNKRKIQFKINKKVQVLGFAFITWALEKIIINIINHNIINTDSISSSL